MADALFIPSGLEGYGITLLEAAAARQTIACAGMPIFKEMCGPEAGLPLKKPMPAGAGGPKARGHFPLMRDCTALPISSCTYSGSMNTYGFSEQTAGTPSSCFG